jgi:prophage regulatory protein
MGYLIRCASCHIVIASSQQFEGHIKMKALLLKLKEIVKICGISKATIYRLIKAGKFPEPISVSHQAKRWRSSDIDTWVTNPVGWK